MAAPYKVSISCMGEKIVFEASPTLAESRTANWSPYDIVHLPTTIYAYKNTSARTYSLTAKLVSRNVKEAAANARVLNMIRAWVLPDFGGTGATPPIVTITAYKNANIDKLPAIITDYGWTFDDATDYIFTGTEPMPVIGNLTVSLAEIYSPQDITAVDPWKIKSPSGGILGSTPNVAAFGDAFSGLMNNNAVQQAINALDAANNTVQSTQSIINNAISEATAAGRNITNSPQISQATSAIQAITNNQFLNSIAPGETASAVNQVAQATRSVGDAFGRVARSVGGPIFG